MGGMEAHGVIRPGTTGCFGLDPLDIVLGQPFWYLLCRIPSAVFGPSEWHRLDGKLHLVFRVAGHGLGVWIMDLVWSSCIYFLTHDPAMTIIGSFVSHSLELD